jgi:hypothetical protein
VLLSTDCCNLSTEVVSVLIACKSSLSINSD